MAERTIPVDLFNPGHVFACIGFMEAAAVLFGDADGRFDWAESDGTFTLRTEGEDDPVEAVARFLWGARVSAEFPVGHGPDAEKFAKWNLEWALRRTANVHSEAMADAADRAWTVLECGGRRVVIDHYADGSSRDAMKFWAGAGGKPGARSVKDCLEALRTCDQEAVVRDPLAVRSRAAGAPLTGGLRLDWRRDYVALDAGFSPNEQGAVVMLGFPLVEVLAAVGLGQARPSRVNRLEYRYAVAGGAALPLILHRAALGLGQEALPGLPTRRFAMRLAWPGQEGQARCIAGVSEYSSAVTQEDRT